VHGSDGHLKDYTMAKAKNPVQGDLFAEEVEAVPVAIPDIPHSWRRVLADEFTKPYWAELQEFIKVEREKYTVYPPADEAYTAFRHTPFEDVHVFLLGQDPYPGPNQAHGLCFSVKPSVPLPGSLRNMFKELRDDLGIPPAKNGYLVNWAQQGILMLNAVLTVRAGQPNSHKGKGWEVFTDAAIRAVNEKEDAVVFVLWGAYAQKKIKLIDTDKHTVVQSAHPSPLSAANGFFGSRPYSKINTALKENGFTPIDWDLSR
jgi:uracil-DNA glycosylase